MITAKAYYDQLFQEATVAHQSGHLTQAIALYRQLTKDTKGQPEPYHRLGLIYAQKEQFKEAIAYFDKALDMLPNHPLYNLNCAEALQRTEQNDRAIACLSKALVEAPDFFEAKQKLGMVLRKVGQLEQAVNYFKEVISAQPKYYPAHFQLGTLMLETGNFKSAKTHLETAVELNPSAIKALNNLAVTLQEWDEPEEALAVYKKALAIDPNYQDAVRNLALLSEKIGLPDEAKTYWLRLAQLKDNNPLIHWKAQIVGAMVSESSEAINHFRETIRKELALIKTKKIKLDVDQLTKMDIYPPAGIIYHGQNDLEIRQAYGALYSSIPQVTLPPRLAGKPKVGFVVTNGHEGVFLKCMGGMINHLSTDKFDISIVCSLPNGDKIIRPKINNPAIKLVSMPKSLEQSVQLLASLNFDFLHYWEVGTDASNYFIPYFKPARVQCTSWGWPTTSGIPTMDYFLSCKGLDGAEDQKHYSEQLVLFDKLPIYYGVPEVPALDKTRADFGLSAEDHLYLCVQNVRKVHPDMDPIVLSILEKDPLAQVVFLGDQQPRLAAALAARLKQNCGSHADRVRVLDRQDNAGYFNILHLADVVLDTLYYNGGANTNADAFALDQPVVTLPVDFHRGRYTAAAYRQMGMDELIAQSMDHWADLAVQVATDLDFRQKVKQKIADTKHLFFEDLEAVKELEAFIAKVTEGLDTPVATKPAATPAPQAIEAQEWFEKGLQHQKLHQLKPAFDALNHARQLDPTNPNIFKKFAMLLADLGKNKDAFIAYTKALEGAPDDPETLNNFGGLLMENKQFEEAIPLLKKSTAVDPKQLSAFVNLGLSYENIGEIPAAQAVYKQITARLAADDLFRLHIDTLCPNLAQSQEEIDTYQAKVKKVLADYDHLLPLSLSPIQLEQSYAYPSFSLSYQGRNVKEIKALWGDFYAKRIQPVTLGAKNTKPKIGFLVTATHEGVFIKGISGLIKNLSSEKFDIVVLANGTEAVAQLKQVIQREDVTYVSVSKLLKNAVSEIASFNFDFLYYWEIGSDGLNYFLPFYQLARVQVSSWGSAFTSGNPRVQYYWSSQWLESEAYPEHYTEEVIRFKNLPTYYYPQPQTETTMTRADLDLPADQRIYLCVQSMEKFHPDFDALILGILEQDDQALVCLMAPKQKALVSQLNERLERSLGEKKPRVKIINRVSHQAYLQLIRLADVCLDPPHYSGANTTYETLQMGVPVAALAGSFQRGKYTEAIYRILGLDDLVAQSPAAYVQLATALAQDQELKNRCTQTYLQNANRLFEQQGLVDEIEHFLADTFNELD